MIDEMVLSLTNNVKMQWSAARRILRFDQKLESAVSRMARLGAIEEEEYLKVSSQNNDLSVEDDCANKDDRDNMIVGGPSDKSAPQKCWTG